jgi:hypothetical protein
MLRVALCGFISLRSHESSNWRRATPEDFQAALDRLMRRHARKLLAKPHKFRAALERDMRRDIKNGKLDSVWGKGDYSYLRLSGGHSHRQRRAAENIMPILNSAILEGPGAVHSSPETIGKFAELFAALGAQRPGSKAGSRTIKIREIAQAARINGRKLSLGEIAKQAQDNYMSLPWTERAKVRKDISRVLKREKYSDILSKR